MIENEKMSVRSPRSLGFTILEIMIAVVILGIIAAAAAPLARTTVQRKKEMELRQVLRMMRAAIDEYKKLGYDPVAIAHEEFGTLMNDLTIKQASGIIDILKNEIEANREPARGRNG